MNIRETAAPNPEPPPVTRNALPSICMDSLTDAATRHCVTYPKSDANYKCPRGGATVVCWTVGPRAGAQLTGRLKRLQDGAALVLIFLFRDQAVILEPFQCVQ